MINIFESVEFYSVIFYRLLSKKHAINISLLFHFFIFTLMIFILENL